MTSKYPIEFEIDDKGLQEWLNSLKMKAENAEAALSVIGNEMVKSIRTNFRVSGRPEKWTELSHSTIYGSLRSRDFKKNGNLKEATKKKLTSRKILIGIGMQGGLMDSIHFSTDKTSVTIGPDNRPYARIHQFGGKAGRGKKVTIPARPYLLFQDEDLTLIKRIITNHLLND